MKMKKDEGKEGKKKKGRTEGRCRKKGRKKEGRKEDDGRKEGRRERAGR